MRKYLILFCSIFLFQSCVRDNKDLANESIITIILENVVENKSHIFKSGVSARISDACELNWVNKKEIESSYCLDPAKENDTITIELGEKRDHIQIAHIIQGLDYMFYYIPTGDTLHITYDQNNLPIAQSTKLDESINIFRDHYIGYYQGENNPEIFLRSDFTRQIYARWDEVQSNIQLNRLKEDYMNLDSIFHHTEYIYHKKLQALDSINISNKDIIRDIIKKMRLLTYLSASSVPRFSPFDRSFYQGQSFDKWLISDRIYFKSYFNNYIINNDSIYNEINENLSFELKRYLNQLKLQHSFESITQNGFERIEENYLNHFSNEADTSFVENLKKSYGYSTVKSDLEILDIKGKTKLLKEVIDSSNKIWYLDFWASWCAPCRKEFPHSLKLQEEFKNESVGFMYLAFNDKIENWKKIIEKEGDGFGRHNYFITNSRSANFVSNVQLNSLPRYMIMDNTGNIIVSSAMRPSNENVSSHLKDLLRED